MVCPASQGSCLPLSPIVPFLVSLCWMVCQPSRGSCLPLVSPCANSCFPLLAQGSCLPLSPIVPLLVSLCWMVCPPSRGSCLPLSPIVLLLGSLSWMVCPASQGFCLPLSPIVPLLVSLCWMVRPPFSGVLCPFVSQLYPFLFPFVGRCVRLPEDLVSTCLPFFPLRWMVFPLPKVLPATFCWMVCPPSGGLGSACLPLSPVVSLFVFLCWMMCPPSQGFVPLVSKLVSQLVSQLVTPACLPVQLVSLFSCFPLLDGVSAFPRSCLPLSPILSLLVYLCWMACPPSRGLVFLVSQLVSQLVSRLVSLIVFLLASLGWVAAFSRPCLPACLPRESRILSLSSGIENDVIFHFHPPIFRSKYFQPHRMFPSSSVATKQAKPNKNKREVVSGTNCRHFHGSCRCYFICLALLLKT